MGDRKKTRTAARFRLETLDDRIVPVTRFWTGAADNLWSTGDNWVTQGGTTGAPQPGDDLVFQATVTPAGGTSITAANLSNNNNIPGLVLSSIAVNAPGYTLNDLGVTLTGGSAAVPAGGITGNFAVATGGAAGVSTIGLPVTFAQRAQAITTLSSTTTLNFSNLAPITLGTPAAPVNLTFAVVPASGQAGGGGGGTGLASSVTLNGVINGVGNVTVGSPQFTANGQVAFAPAGRNGYSGTTTVTAGTLLLAGTGQPAPDFSFTVPGRLVVGDDVSVGGGLASVVLGASEQINDTADVEVRSDGTLNLGAFTETIQNLRLGTSVGAGGVIGTGVLGLNGDLSVTASGQNNTINPAISLGVGPHRFTVGGGSVPTQTVPDLTIVGPITGFANSALRFEGNGRTELRGASALNAAAFPTTIASGRVDLFELSAGTGSVLPGNVTIGEGGAGATLRLLVGNGIADAGVVTLGPGGLLDLSNTLVFETIGGLSSDSGSSRVLLGRSSILTVQPTINTSFAGEVTGDGRIVVEAAGGLATGSQRLTGRVNLTGGTFFGTRGLQAAANGVIVVDSTNVSGGVSTNLTNGVIAGIGTVDILDASSDFVRPGTYAPGAGISPAAFTPGTLTTAQLSLFLTTLDIQIEDADTFGQLRVTQGFLNNSTSAFIRPTLQVSLPTGFVPSGGQAFTILDLVPVGLTLNSQGFFNGLFQDPNGGLLNEGDVFTAFNSNQRFAISYRGGDGNDVVIFNTLAPSSVVSGGTVSGNTVSFTATFSGPVGPINPSSVNVTTTGDVTFSFVNTTRLTDTTYLITINGVTGTGSVGITLDQGAAFSGAGTPIQPSNTVTTGVNVPIPVPPSPPTPIGNNGRTGGRLLVGAGVGGAGAANVYQGQSVASQALNLPVPQFAAGTRVATGDFNRDGVRDYVFATGPGTPAFFQVLDGRTGALLFSAAPFGDFTGGLFVATGDLTGDGVLDLVVTPDEGGGPRVMVFDGGRGFTVIADFFAIDDPDFRGGARAAIGDLNGDGFGDLVVSAGFGGGPRVAVFDGRTVPGGFPTKLINDFFVFEPALRNGAYVAVVDVNGDGNGDLIAGGGPGGSPRVSVFDGSQLAAGAVTQVSSFFAGNPTARGGIRLAAADFDGNGTLALVTGAGEGDGSQVRVYMPANLVTSDPIAEAVFDAFPGFTGGVFVG